jgi:nitrilase
VKYLHNSLSVNSDEMDRLRVAAKENHIVVVLGYSERAGDSLYMGQSIIDATGELLLSRRKIKPTHMERTVFGDPAGGADTLFNVVKTTVGRVSGLLCWVCIAPLQMLTDSTPIIYGQV